MKLKLKTEDCTLTQSCKQSLFGKGMAHAAHWNVNLMSITEVRIRDLGDRFAVYFYEWGSLLHTYFEAHE